MANYDLRAAINAAQNRVKPKTFNFTKNPPKVKAAPNQPTEENGGLATDDFEQRVNNQAKNLKEHSANNSANSSNSKQTKTLDFKKNTTTNPKGDKNSANPNLGINHTPTQLITQLAQMLQVQGIPTLWQQSFPCPCMNKDGLPKSDCPICHGLGLAFRDPIELNIAFQHDNRQYYNGRDGNDDTGLTLATPQITENGFENGISPRDRLTVEEFPITQTYAFNVSSDRIQTGEYIPYKVQSIDLATTIENGQLKVLHQDKDFRFNKSASVITPNKEYLNHNITLVMSIDLRFYVTNTLKETRYAATSRFIDKRTLNPDNKLLTKYMQKYKQASQPGMVYYRMPKLLQVKRENVVLGNWDYSKKTGTKQRNIKYHQTQVARNPNNPLNIF